MRIALIGGGVIGRGWAAYLLSRGHDVVLFDPAHDQANNRAALADYIDAARPSLEQLGGDLSGWQARCAIADSIAEAVREADWVQENGPEAPEIKAAMYAEIDAHAPATTIAASSSSGTLPSALVAACPRHPERVVIGHPFNPAYLIPLVEVVGAPTTPAETIERALAFYREIGKKPVHVRTEVPGYLANRLQAALWREAYSLVERGVASVADIDTVISQGPGLRWALLGPLVNQHLSGGPATETSPGGIAHILEHLGPPTQKWMDDLGAPQLNPRLAQLLIDGVDEELAGVDTAALTAERDRLLVELLRMKEHAHDLP